VTLTWLAEHLGLPKSTTSVAVKSLGQRGFVERARDGDDERRLAIVLTDKGKARVAADTVLEPKGLKAAMAKLPPAVRAAMLDGLAKLADAAETARRRGT
jgi:DNA-binding MarR family transcriptional regulator